MSYQLKNIKTLNTSNGVAWTASVYRDGKRIGTAEDRGDGGCTYTYNISHADEVALIAWVAEQVQGSGLWMEQYATDIRTVRCAGTDEVTYEPRLDMEMALAYLMEIADLDKKSRTSIVFRVSRGIDPQIGEDYDTYTLKSTTGVTVGGREIMYISSKYPTAQIWQPAQHRWTSLNSLVGA